MWGEFCERWLAGETEQDVDQYCHMTRWFSYLLFLSSVCMCVGGPRGVVASVLDFDIVVMSSNSSRAIMFSLRLMPLKKKKKMKPLNPPSYR